MRRADICTKACSAKAQWEEVCLLIGVGIAGTNVIKHVPVAFAVHKRTARSGCGAFVAKMLVVFHGLSGTTTDQALAPPHLPLPA